MQLVLDQLESPLPQTAALLSRLARRTPVSTKTCSVTLDPSVSNGYSWKHMQNLSSQQQHSCSSGEGMRKHQHGYQADRREKTHPASLINFQTGCLFLIERHARVLPGGRNLGTAVGQALSFPTLQVCLHPDRNARHGTEQAWVNHRSLTAIETGPKPRGNLHWWEIQFPTNSPVFCECVRDSDHHQTLHLCAHLGVASG